MKNIRINDWLLSRSYVANFAGSLMVFASVIAVGLPDQIRQETIMYKERERVWRDRDEKKYWIIRKHLKNHILLE